MTVGTRTIGKRSIGNDLPSRPFEQLNSLPGLEILSPELSDEERSGLEKSADNLRKALQRVS